MLKMKKKRSEKKVTDKLFHSPCFIYDCSFRIRPSTSFCMLQARLVSLFQRKGLVVPID